MSRNLRSRLRHEQVRAAVRDPKVGYGRANVHHVAEPVPLRTRTIDVEEKVGLIAERLGLFLPSLVRSGPTLLYEESAELPALHLELVSLHKHSDDEPQERYRGSDTSDEVPELAKPEPLAGSGAETRPDRIADRTYDPDDRNNHRVPNPVPRFAALFYLVAHALVLSVGANSFKALET